MDFKEGQRYKGTNFQGEPVLLEITKIIDGKCDFNLVSGAVGFTKPFSVNSGFAERLSPDRPRICEVLGVEVGECFNINGSRGHNFRVYDCDHLSYDGDGDGWYDIVCAIDHPEKIIRTPQFSEDEKANLKALVNFGFPWIGRGKKEEISAFEKMPEKCSHGYFNVIDGACDEDIIPTEMFKAITWENSPFNAAEYLEVQK